MPIKIINGKQSGPTLLCYSTLNGNEFNGIEILNQLYDQVSASDLCGTLILVPVVNIYALSHFPKRSPSGENLTDAFPGKEKGSFNERVAYLFTQELIKKADYCIECQTGALNHEILPQVYCDYEDNQLKNLAKVFQTPVITEVEMNASKLRQTMADLNIPLLVYEAGEAMRLDTNAINIGVNGIFNVMSKIEMLDKNVDMSIKPITSKDDAWLLSHSSGILTSYVSLGEQISKGHKLGRLSDPFSHENATMLTAKTDGVIVGINRSPLIQEGSAVFKIASFLDNKKAEALIEVWDDAQPQ